MMYICTRNMSIFLCIVCITVSGLPFCFGIDNTFLKVGEERWAETMPLQMGSRLYQLRGLKADTWYEVKISYPASIPASFSLQLKRGIPGSDLGLNRNRRLLNTEKLIFKNDCLDLLRNKDEMYVLVNVEPEGIVAIPNMQERDHIIFNIVCDELFLGIPRQAWWVVLLVLVCLISAFTVPKFIPLSLLPNNRKVSARRAEETNRVRVTQASNPDLLDT